MKNILIIVLILWFNPPVRAEQAPDFNMRNLDGKLYLSRSALHSIVVSFFFVDCVPCKKEIPLLYHFIRGEYPGIDLLLVDPVPGDTHEDIIELSERLGVPKSYFFQDVNGMTAEKFFKNRPRRFPTIYGISRGKLIFEFAGFSDAVRDKMSSILEMEY